MCLILFAHRVHPDVPLIVAANRDEFHGRATAHAGFWDDHAEVLAGRDLEAGGTWLGVNRRGRFAAVTNFTEPPPNPLPPRSRGSLVSDFLTGSTPPGEYLTEVARNAYAYRGFNLVAGTAEELWYYSNRIEAPCRLTPGTYGLSNHLLDTAWPKVRRGKSALAAFEEAEAQPDVNGLLDVLADDTVPTDAEIGSTALDPDTARRIAPCFIRGPVYGTRASTVAMIEARGRVVFTEVAFGPEGRRAGRRDFTFERNTPAVQPSLGRARNG